MHSLSSWWTQKHIWTEREKKKTNEFDDDKDDDKVSNKKRYSNFMTQMEQSFILHTNHVNIKVRIYS